MTDLMKPLNHEPVEIFKKNIALVGAGTFDKSSAFVNGYKQNVHFFHHFFKKHFSEYNLILINNADDLFKSVFEIDLFIQFTPFDKTLENYIKTKHPNHKSVFVKYGHEYYIDLSRLLPEGQNNVIHSPKAHNINEVWISPHFESTKYYYEAIYNAKVKIAPFIWKPDVIKMSSFIKSDFENCEKNIYIVEPHINTLKTALIPILIVNELYKKYPHSFNKLYIVSNNSYPKNQYFNKELLSKIEVCHGANNKTFFCKRAAFPDIFKNPAILLSHQENCGLNYMYLEALHIRIPWVHNSPFFKDSGYYYTDKNIPEGVLALKKALDEFKPVNNSHILKKYDSENPIIINKYKEMIDNLI